MEDPRGGIPLMKPLPSPVAGRLRSEALVNAITTVLIELLDNALDAGATAIIIEADLERFELRVSDDGRGIRGDEFPILGQRCCTSKLSSLAQLEGGLLSSRGFRGEALCSIGACSVLEITSKARNEVETHTKIVRVRTHLASFQLAYSPWAIYYKNELLSPLLEVVLEREPLYVPSSPPPYFAETRSVYPHVAPSLTPPLHLQKEVCAPRVSLFSPRCLLPSGGRGTPPLTLTPTPPLPPSNRATPFCAAASPRPPAPPGPAQPSTCGTSSSTPLCGARPTRQRFRAYGKSSCAAAWPTYTSPLS